MFTSTSISIAYALHLGFIHNSFQHFIWKMVYRISIFYTFWNFPLHSNADYIFFYPYVSLFFHNSNNSMVATALAINASVTHLSYCPSQF